MIKLQGNSFYQVFTEKGSYIAGTNDLYEAIHSMNKKAGSYIMCVEHPTDILMKFGDYINDKKWIINTYPESSYQM